MKRLLRNWLRVTLACVAIAALAFAAYRLWRGPDPETILARLDVPPAPVLDPDQERATFRLAPGFRAELVAAEPLVVDPVAMDWDDEGRLYVVEMRGFMGDIDGAGETRPVGRVVVLQDLDGDGQMDESHIFLDGLVLPRAIAVLPEGVLIGAPPDLVLCRDRNDDLRCEASERERLGPYAAEAGNVEHRENGLLPALDGWIYNAKSARRFRLRNDSFEIEETLFRGQWGLTQDDEGRLYYNHNSGFLYVDQIPAEPLLRQPAIAARLRKPGINVDLAPGEKVWGVRVAAGLNRAYQPGSLRPDGRQNGPTAISGLVIQRGDQYGDAYKGDAFVPESAGSAVARFSIEHDGLSVSAEHQLYADPDWEKREFLASTDERFRPVDAKVGPDGAIWVIDMYRGVIQHAHYVSDHLREYVAKQGLAEPGATGRIWRLVRSDQPIDYAPPPLASLEEQLRGLDHPNGWVRDRATRRLAAKGGPRIVTALRQLESFEPLGRVHALWALHRLVALDLDTWETATADETPLVRLMALRVGERLLPEASEIFRRVALERLEESHAEVRLQAIHSLGALAPSSRPVEALLSLVPEANAVERQAVLSSLTGLEYEILHELVTAKESTSEDWIRSLAAAAFMAAQASEDSQGAVTQLLDLIHEYRNEDIALLLLDGIREAQTLPGHMRVVLVGAHAIFDGTDGRDFVQAARLVRSGFTWEGDPNPGGARALTAEEERRRDQGEALFAATCATCHGGDGRGRAGLAPPLAGSPWARDADDWLIRIVLQGLRGPIQVHGVEWDSAMPGHAHDPRFDDEALSGLATHIRRAWGHADEPIPPETVRRIRDAVVARSEPWTAEELASLDVTHRLDRFTGIYRVPILGIEMIVRREGAELMIGRRQGGQAPLLEITDGLFTGEGMQLLFDATVEGPPTEAEVTFGDQAVTVSRVEGLVPD